MVTAMLTLQLNVYTVAISSVNKIVTNKWLRLNNSGFLMKKHKAAVHKVLMPGGPICLGEAIRPSFA
jgi:hypothetical protein